MKKRIAVIMGGPGEEHEASKDTGRNILLNLDNNKYEGIPITISKEGEWEVSLEELNHHADVAFISIHGSYGEDGTIQSELEEIGIPYTGSNIHSSALGMNKLISLNILKKRGFNTPRLRHVGWTEWLDNADLIINEIELSFGFPMVVKPNRGSLGNQVVIIEDNFKLRSVLEKLFENNKDLLVQEYIPGREIVCGVYDHGIEGTAHPVAPIEVNRRFNTKKFPDDLSEPLINKIRKSAKDIHELLELSGISLIDFILGDDNNLYVLEVNTVPELTRDSSFVKGIEFFGLKLKDLLSIMLESAERKFNGR